MSASFQSIGVLCVVYDRVAEVDSFPRLYQNEADAVRDFIKHVNMPSDSMLFHSYGDFELVFLARCVRNADGRVEVASLHPREVLVTGSAAIDEAARARYIQLSVVTNQAQEIAVNAQKQVGLSS